MLNLFYNPSVCIIPRGSVDYFFQFVFFLLSRQDHFFSSVYQLLTRASVCSILLSLLTALLYQLLFSSSTVALVVLYVFFLYCGFLFFMFQVSVAFLEGTGSLFNTLMKVHLNQIVSNVNFICTYKTLLPLVKLGFMLNLARDIET